MPESDANRLAPGGRREFGNPLPDLLTDFLAGNDLTVVGRLDATLNGSSSGFINFDLGFVGDEEIRLGFGHVFTITEFGGLFEFAPRVELRNQRPMILKRTAAA